MSASHPGRPPGWCNETNALHRCHVVDGIKGPLYHNGQNSAKKKKEKDFSQESLKVGRQNVWRYIGTLRGALVKMLKLHTGSLFFGKSLQYASKMNETLVFWMPPEGPRTPVAFIFIFHFLLCCFESKYLWDFVCFGTHLPPNQDFWNATPPCYCYVWDQNLS